MPRDNKRSPAGTAAESASTTNADRIVAYHQLGKKIARRVDQGSSIDSAIRDEGYGNSRFTAYKAHQFARVIDSDAELQRYLSVAKQGRFSWTHIQALLLIKEPGERRQFFRTALAGRWTPKRLRLEITHRSPFGTRGLHRQGRKFRVPKSAEDLRASLVEMLRRPYGLLEQLLTGDALIALELDAAQEKCLAKLKSGIDEFARAFSLPDDDAAQS